MMNRSKWKSVSVNTESYDLLRALGDVEFRNPPSMIAKLIHDFVKVQADENEKDQKIYKKELLSGKYKRVI